MIYQQSGEACINIITNTMAGRNEGRRKEGGGRRRSVPRRWMMAEPNLCVAQFPPCCSL